MKPTVARIVHYVSHGTPVRPDGTQAYHQACRAAIVTEVGAWIPEPGLEDVGKVLDVSALEMLHIAGASRGALAALAGNNPMRLTLQTYHADALHLDVRTPQGGFVNISRHDDGGETPGDPNCPNRAQHGDPFRYCSCGWTEATYAGGTWHWPERVEA